MNADHERAVELWKFLCKDSSVLHVMTVEGAPKSKARPRFRRDGKVFASPEQVAAEQALGWFLRQRFPEPMTGNIAVGCIFFRANKQRIDVDNMLKHVMDSANKICWLDDSQVTAQLGIVEYDPVRPRTIITIGEHVSSLDRSPPVVQTCAKCGKEFTSFHARGKFCSRACSSRSRGEDLSEPVACGHCGMPFKRITANRRYCSHECRMEALRLLNQRKRVA